MGFFDDWVIDPAGVTSGKDKPGSVGNLKGGGDMPPNEAAIALANIAKELHAESTPLRRQLLGRSGQFMAGDLDVTASPQFEGLKAGSDLAFNRARTNTIANTPSGGGLIDALTNLETNRAVGMAQGAGSIAESELMRALGLATGSNPSVTSGLGQAAGIQGQALNQQSASNAQAKQGAGAGAGALLAAFLA